MEGEYEPIDISAERARPSMSGHSEELGLRLCAMEWSKRDEILLSVQPNMRASDLAANFQRWQLLFQDVDTGRVRHKHEDCW